MVYVKFQLTPTTIITTTSSRIGSPFLLASTWTGFWERSQWVPRGKHCLLSLSSTLVTWRGKSGHVIDFGQRGPNDEKHPLPKAAKPVWAKQLIRLPCLVVYVTFQFTYPTLIVTFRSSVIFPWEYKECPYQFPPCTPQFSRLNKSPNSSLLWDFCGCISALSLFCEHQTTPW